MKVFSKDKRIINSIVIFLLVALLSSNVFASPVRIMVENKYIEMPVDPIIKEGRTLVPLRAIFETLGAKVEWDQATRTVTGKTEDRTIKLQINNKVAKVNGKDVILDVPAEIVEGNTLVPVRFVSESLGSAVDYKDGIVYIDSDVPGAEKEKEIPKYKVLRVVDGDTLIIDLNGKSERVRLIGVDTPESVHPDSSKNVPEGKIASDYVTNLLEGKEVGLELDVQERDHYGRILGYVYVNDVMLNKHLLEKGYAKLATYPPNVKYVEDFTEIQADARKKNKGFWKNGEYLNNNSSSEEQKKTSGEFIGSLRSDKFHRPTCRWAKNIKVYNETWFTNRADAISQGYKPCGTCRP